MKGSMGSFKPLQYLSADDIAFIVDNAKFHAFNVGDSIIQQVCCGSMRVPKIVLVTSFQGQEGCSFFVIEIGSVRRVSHLFRIRC